MRKLKVFYLFRRPVHKDLKRAVGGTFPHDYFFAFTKLSGSIDKSVTEKVFSNKFISAIDQLIIKATYPFMKIGFSFFSVFYQLPEIKKADVLFATTDSFGIPLLLLKQLRIINKPIVINTGGFFDGFRESKSSLYKKMSVLFFGNVSTVISGVENECKLMSKDLNLPIEKLALVPYGVDTDYFKPGLKSKSEKKNDFILTVGADFKRDWSTFKKVVENLPKKKFVIITAQDQIKIKMPTNVKILYNLPIEEVRMYIRKALLIVILSKQNYRFAGSSTILRSMSCGKAVIFTESFGVSELPFKNHKHAVLVSIHNSRKIIFEINNLISDKKKIIEIAKEARKYVLKYNNYREYTLRLEKIFKDSVFNEKIN